MAAARVGARQSDYHPWADRRCLLAGRAVFGPWIRLMVGFPYRVKAAPGRAPLHSSYGLYSPKLTISLAFLIVILGLQPYVQLDESLAGPKRRSIRRSPRLRVDCRPLGHWPETAFWEITPVVVPQANLTPRRSILGGMNQMLALADHLGSRRYFNAYAPRSPIPRPASRVEESRRFQPLTPGLYRKSSPALRVPEIAVPGRTLR